eukprot:3397810-Pleurochrysis_carterae.AAC.6
MQGCTRGFRRTWRGFPHEHHTAPFRAIAGCSRRTEVVASRALFPPPMRPLCRPGSLNCVPSPLLPHASPFARLLQLAEMLEKDVKDIQRMAVVDCYQIAKKRLANLFDIVTTHEREKAGTSSD